MTFLRCYLLINFQVFNLKHVCISLEYFCGQFYWIGIATKNSLLVKYLATRTPSSLGSVFSLKSEYWPKNYALFFKGSELRNELIDLKILVTMKPRLEDANGRVLWDLFSILSNFFLINLRHNLCFTCVKFLQLRNFQLSDNEGLQIDNWIHGSNFHERRKSIYNGKTCE